MIPGRISPCNKLRNFLVKTIAEKQEALTCLETVEAPVFMCQQMHLNCATCRPRQGGRCSGPPWRHAERVAEELTKMKEAGQTLTLTPTPTQKWDLSYTLKLVFTTHPPPTPTISK